MRTTISLDAGLIEEVKRLTGEEGLSRAVASALDEFVRRHAVEEIRALVGKVEIEDNWEELERAELEDEPQW